jgi:hypothetical protein
MKRPTAFVAFCGITAAGFLVAGSCLVAQGRMASTAEDTTQVESKAPIPTTTTPQSAKYESVVLQGKVVELAPYLAARFGVVMDDDAAKLSMALVTEKGDVHPLVKDLRSRGFWMDKRLRDRPMELHVHKFPGLPLVRIIDVYSFKDGKKCRVDYWCTVCAITTFEPGPCPCCQEDIELREKPVEEN